MVNASWATSGGIDWLKVPVGLVWGCLLCWWARRFAQRRLENSGPELFSLVRKPTS